MSSPRPGDLAPLGSARFCQGSCCGAASRRGRGASSPHRPQARNGATLIGHGTWLAVALCAVLLASGCGYSLRPSLPPGIKTVHIPVLVNRTQEPGIEDFLTQALTQALVTSGLARIAPNAEQADGVLEGSIVEYSLTSLAFDRVANVTQYRLQITLALTLRDRIRNEVVWRQERISERADFPVSGQVTTTIAREEQAVRRAAVDVSRAIISLAFEGF